jgi:hypothetical protein
MQAGLESKANQKKPAKKYQELYIHGKLMCDIIRKHKNLGTTSRSNKQRTPSYKLRI